MNLLEVNASKLFEILHTDPSVGLKSEEAKNNISEFSSSKRTPRSLLAVIRSIFSDVMPLMFVALSVMCAMAEGSGKPMLILAVYAVFYVALKYISVRYVAKVSKSLNRLSSKCRIIRDGTEISVDASELAPGDIMLVSLGEVVPCDAIVLAQSGLRVSEVQLTGSSEPVLKRMQEDVLVGKGVPYYDCIIFAGSVVVSGEGKVLVCNVGRDVFDKKNKLTTRSKHGRRTKIFEVSAFVSQQMSLIQPIAAFFLVVIGALKGTGLIDMMLLAVAMAALSFPDLILTLFDLNLYVGANRLYKKGCTIRDMAAIDRMCDISCIIVDDTRYFRAASPKPNTVYVNDERKRFRGAGESDVRELFEMAVVACVGRDGGMSYNGISVERSLLNCADELGIPVSRLYQKYLLLERRPFTSENKMSRVIVFKDSEFFVISIGTPSVVLKTCTHIENKGQTLLLGEKQRREIRDISRVIARGNEGVIAVAVKKIEYKEGTEQIMSDRGYSFKGYIGLHTPIKADSAKAINLCQKCGTDVVLMTSEGLSTSVGFAKSISILKEDDRVIEGKELVNIDRGLFRADIKDYKVYVGLAPETKAEIASYRKQDGDIIGVIASNSKDLRLLLEADVSFCTADTAMEASGQNSDVLIDGSFDLIPECIKYARSVYRNTRHMLQYALSYQFVFLFSVLLSLLFMGGSVITAPMAVMYSVFAYLPLVHALATQMPKGDEIKDGFGLQNLEINVQNLLMTPSICGFVGALVITLSAKSAFITSMPIGVVNGSAFITLISSAVFMAFALSAEESFDIGIFKSIKLIVSGLAAFAAMLLFTLIRPLASLMDITAPDPERYALAIIMGFVPALVCIGIRLVKKYVFNKNN